MTAKKDNKNHYLFSCFIIILSLLVFTACENPIMAKLLEPLVPEKGGVETPLLPEEEPRHIHEWGEWKVTTVPTCTEAGEETRTCALDATHIETRPIGPIGHEWGEWVVTREPTCTEQGENTRKCVHDPEHHIETQPIEAIGHEWGSWTVTTAPTCTEVGEETRKCLHNDLHIETRPVEAIGHEWGEWELTNTNEEEHWWEETRRCLHDDSHFETRRRVELPDGYTWGEWVVDLPPTCTEPGEQTRTCVEDPSYTEKLSIDALGHDWNYEWDDKWEVTKEPTDTEEGEETRRCLHDDSHFEMRSLGIIPALEYFYIQVARYANTSTDMTILVKQALNLPEPVMIPVPGASGKTLTIKGEGATRTLWRKFQDTNSLNGLFVVPNGAKLVFENITIDGDKNTYINNAAPLVRVNSGGTLTLTTGAALQSNRAINGGGVYVADGGVLIMGGNAIVSDNIERDSPNANNVYLGNSYITLGTGSNGANVPASGMKIYAHTARADGVIVESGADEGQEIYFKTDEDGKTVVFHNNQLVFAELVIGKEGFYEQVAKYANASANLIIAVREDITLDRIVNVLANAAGRTLIITSEGGERTLMRGFQDTNANNGLFMVPNGVKLIIENIIIDGNKTAYANNAASLVRVNGGEFTMNAGALLKNNRARFGGGVYVIGGAFTMHDGTISDNTANNSGGGVIIEGGGTFTMNSSGEIHHNTASAGGGVTIGGDSAFTMNGGEISGNTANGSGGGGGVRIAGGSKSIFIMNSGEISDNTANCGGGLYVSSGTFTMNSGKINGNQAMNGGGGGVAIYDDGNIGSTFTMNGGEISGNISNNGGGGGVRVVESIFTMNSGTISGNKVLSPNCAGGVLVGDGAGHGGIFNMKGGTISGNTAIRDGGGVYVDYSSYAIFRISNGVIYGAGEAEGVRNTAGGNGASLARYSAASTVQYGTFNGDTWSSNGNLANTNNTIRVVNGELQ